MTTIKTSNLGFPRLGRKREWKKAIESYWAKKISKEELDQTLTDLHKENLLLQKYYHLDSIPVGDFSLYDHILDTSLLFNSSLNVSKEELLMMIYYLILLAVIKTMLQVHL